MGPFRKDRAGQEWDLDGLDTPVEEQKTAPAGPPDDPIARLDALRHLGTGQPEKKGRKRKAAPVSSRPAAEEEKTQPLKASAVPEPEEARPEEAGDRDWDAVWEGAKKRGHKSRRVQKRMREKRKAEKKHARQKGLTEDQRKAMEQLEGADVDGFDAWRMIEKDEIEWPRWARILVPVVLVIAVVFGIGLFGYFETDISNDGTPQIVSIQTRTERRYVARSDELLQMEIDCASYIQTEAGDLSDFIEVSGQLKQQYAALNEKTNELSRYVEVPEAMSAYHKELINTSLGLQKLQSDILENYNASDYQDWLQSSVMSMNQSMDALHQMRFQIDLRIWGGQ